MSVKESHQEDHRDGHDFIKMIIPSNIKRILKQPYKIVTYCLMVYDKAASLSTSKTRKCKMVKIFLLVIRLRIQMLKIIFI